MKEYVLKLEQNTLFQGKSREEIARMINVGNGIFKVYQPNDVIFRIGETAFQVAFIIEGTISARRYLPNGKILTIQYKGAGDFVGESSFYAKEKKWSCDIIAGKKCSVILFEKNTLLDLLQSDRLILSNFIQAFSNKIFDLEFKAELMSYSSIQQKIAYFLTYFTNSGTLCFELPFTKKEWAEYMNVSRTSLSRELKKMAEEEILNYSGLHIRIRNLSKIYELLIEG